MDEKEIRASKIIERRGVYFQAFEIYRSISGFYDYGSVGLKIKRNIEGAWRSIFVDLLGATEIETTTIMPEVVFKASGHLSTFTDPITKCQSCKSAYRTDKLLESIYEKKGDEASAAAVRRMSRSELSEKIAEVGAKCERCGNKLSGIDDFNLMFKTQAGHRSEDVAYMRPETAQGIFVDFKTVFRTHSLKLPALVAQVGRAYRNEISPRQHLVRMREFTQMETELFFDAAAEEAAEIGNVRIADILDTKVNFSDSKSEEVVSKSLRSLIEEKKVPHNYLAMFMYLEKKLLGRIGIGDDVYRFKEISKEELPHYSKGNIDLEIKTTYGWLEVSGNAYRTDYDLSQHAKISGEDLSVVNSEKKVLPHVVEASVGLDRLLLSLLDNSVDEGADRGWQWLKLNESVSPYKYAVFALQKDDKLIEIAKRIHKSFVEKGVQSYYSETGSIGKRYAKADEIGVPYAITCDYQSIEDGTVTIRRRDTAKQERVKITEL